MKKILVPTDFSELADMAMNIAVNLTKDSNTEVHLLHSIEMLHVYDELSNDLMVEAKGEGYSYMHVATDRAKQRMNEFKIKLEEKGINCSVEVVSGKPYSAVLNYVDDHDINLVIMGTKGSDGLAEIIIGSNAQKIIRNCNCPVLTVKEGSDNFEFKNIVLASDFNEASAINNISYIGRIAEYFEANVTLLFVATPLNFIGQEELEKKIFDLGEKEGLTNFNVEIFKAESAEEGITEYSQLKQPDVVAISTHGRGFLRKLFISNTTEYLANHLSTPLLSMPLDYEEMEK